MRKNKSVKLPSHYPYLVKSHHLIRNDDEGFILPFSGTCRFRCPCCGVFLPLPRSLLVRRHSAGRFPSDQANLNLKENERG